MYRNLQTMVYKSNYVCYYNDVHSQISCWIRPEIEVKIFFTGSTAPMGPGLFFKFHEHFKNGSTPWTSDQLVARPLPVHKHRKTHTHKH
jgi:hypothetical protein